MRMQLNILIIIQFNYIKKLIIAVVFYLILIISPIKHNLYLYFFLNICDRWRQLRRKSEVLFGTDPHHLHLPINKIKISNIWIVITIVTLPPLILFFVYLMPCRALYHSPCQNDRLFFLEKQFKYYAWSLLRMHVERSQSRVSKHRWICFIHLLQTWQWYFTGTINAIYQ